MLFMHSDPVIFALVDCNNFYASCERLFNPKLNNQPVIILSSNDGCVIARSNEAKALGIQMSQPYFQIEQLCRKNKVHVLSSNFALYGDISHRVMTVLHSFCPDIEIYSIDEAFLRLDTIAFSDVKSYAIKIKNTLMKQVGIPVSIGIAHTKTLAKAASILAKKNHRFSKDSICDLQDNCVKNEALQALPVGDIWGVGKQSAWQLQMMKINTASDLCAADIHFLKKRFSVMMKRIVMELQGTSCLTLEEIHEKKNITCSRSFGKSITTFSDLSQAISHYAARACEKARAEKVKARSIIVYIRTGLFNKAKFYSQSELVQLLYPSNDAVHITQIAVKLLKKMYQPSFQYKKAGIILCDLMPARPVQSDLFFAHQEDNEKIMQILDRINHRFGSHHIFLASEGMRPNWIVKSTKKSPCYTTNWDELKRVIAN